jgi:hypothetical protein
VAELPGASPLASQRRSLRTLPAPASRCGYIRTRTPIDVHRCPSEAERCFRRVQVDVRQLCDMVDSEWTLEREEGEWKMFMQTDPVTGSIRYKGQVERD